MNCACKRRRDKSISDLCPLPFSTLFTVSSNLHTLSILAVSILRWEDGKRVAACERGEPARIACGRNDQSCPLRLGPGQEFSNVVYDYLPEVSLLSSSSFLLSCMKNPLTVVALSSGCYNTASPSHWTSLHCSPYS